MVTPTSFIEEFAEFDTLPEPLIASKIADANLLHSEEAWGPLYDLAIKYTTADLLGMTPEGLNMALKNDEGHTIYFATFKKWVRARNSRRAAVL